MVLNTYKYRQCVSVFRLPHSRPSQTLVSKPSLNLYFSSNVMFRLSLWEAWCRYVMLLPKGCTLRAIESCSHFENVSCMSSLSDWLQRNTHLKKQVFKVLIYCLPVLEINLKLSVKNHSITIKNLLNINATFTSRIHLLSGYLYQNKLASLKLLSHIKI